MKRRLIGNSMGNLPMEDTYSHHYNTGDLKAQKGDEVKLILTSYANGLITPLGKKCLLWINPKEKLVNGAINLEKKYEEINGDGVIITKKNKLVEIIRGSGLSDLNAHMTKEQASNSLFWRVMLRHPDEVSKEFAIPGLCEEAINYVFKERKEIVYYPLFISEEVQRKYNYLAMWVGVSASFSRDNPELRNLNISGMDAWSCANDGFGFDRDFSYLIGILPDALNTSEKNSK